MKPEILGREVGVLPLGGGGGVRVVGVLPRGDGTVLGELGGKSFTRAGRFGATADRWDKGRWSGTSSVKGTAAAVAAAKRR